jgi:anthranilate phosphoribosyltransferase
VVHADNGLDEFSPAGPTAYTELKNGNITEHRVNPAAFALPETSLSELRAAGPVESLALIRQALTGTGPGAPMVAMNAGAALYVAGKASSLGDGIEEARAILTSGRALARLEAFAKRTQALAGSPS